MTFAVSFAGCLVSEGGAEDTRTIQQPLHGGTDDTTEPARYPAVGLLTWGISASQEAVCTATMLNCGVAITAAHCAPESGSGIDLSTTSRIEYATGNCDPAYQGDGHCRIGATKSRQHPEWKPNVASESDYNVVRDVALVALTLPAVRPLTRSLRELQYPRLPLADDPVPQVGQLSTLVGYGLPTDNLQRHVRRFGTFRIDTVSEANLLFGFSFVETVEGLQTDQGDSGGPLLRETDAGQVIVGINSARLGGVAWAANLSAPQTAAWLAETFPELTRDGDGDGIPFACDACPGSPSDLDSDGDLVPDDCDPCPCDPVEIVGHDTGDNDGICDYCEPGLSDACSSYCAGPGGVVDNCRGVFSVDQSNCNLDAEIARHAEILGDACDPVPCPRGAPVLTASTTWQHMGVVHVGTVTSRLERFEIEKVRSRDLSISPPNKFGTITDAADYRYCNKWFDPTVDCFRQNNSVVDDSLLKLETTAAQEESSQTWRRVKIQGQHLDDRDIRPNARGYDECVGELKELEPRCTLTYARTWQWELDLARWAMPRVEPGMPSLLPMGRFWFHTESPVGTTDGTPGVHYEQDSTVPGSSLTNHYEPVLPETSQVTIWDEGNPLYPYLWIQHCPMCNVALRPWDSKINDAMLLAPLGPSFPDRYGVLTRQGTLQEVTGELGPALLASLADTSLIWVSPAEPSPQMGRGMGAPLAVALSADGTRILETIRSDGSRLTGKLDNVFIDAVAMASSATPNLGPPARSGAAVVYARSKAEVYLVGGEDPSTGKPRGDMWVHNLPSGTWVPLVADGYSPRRVLAATNAFGDDRLWVLDEVRKGYLRVRRLVRLDPQSGLVDVVGEWPTFGLFDQHWLLVDRDGAAVLAASSRMLNKHMLVRLKVNAGGVHVDGLHIGQWDLVGAPAIDMAGIWLVRRPSKKQGARVLRLDTIERVPTGWTEVGACLR